MKVRWKKVATICRNYRIYFLEVIFVKLKTTIKNYHEQGLHQLKLKFLPVISTNFDGNFQSTILRVISLFLKCKRMWLSGLRLQAGNQKINGSSPQGTKMSFRFFFKVFIHFDYFCKNQKILKLFDKNC